MKIFIASPLGFAESTHPFIEKLCRAVEALGHEPGDPWSLCGDLEDALRLAETIGDQNERRTELNRITAPFVWWGTGCAGRGGCRFRDRVGNRVCVWAGG